MTESDQIGELVKLAGHRQMPDASAMGAARATAYTEWRRMVARRRRRMLLQAFAAAAAIAVVVSGATWFGSTPERAAAPVVPVGIATVETVIGRALVTSRGSVQGIGVTAGGRLLIGDRVDTSSGGRVVVVLSEGVTAKLDERSSLALDAANTLVLAAGAVFIESDPSYNNAAVQVQTPLGVVRHIGTQFEVRWDDQRLRVRVRDGVISLDNPDGQWTSRGGEALVLARGSVPARHLIATSGPEWGWINQLAPPFTLEGSTLRAFLAWIERHHGIRHQYADPSLRDRVEQIVLHGSIRGLTAEEALAAVLPASGLTFRRQGDVVILAPAGY
jgi:ferric-dicitrate binding protein FerR (iron transport regulator)